MACVAVHPDYRSSSRGEVLLERIAAQAQYAPAAPLPATSSGNPDAPPRRPFRRSSLPGKDRGRRIRRATINDIGGILELISPLEQQGILVRRSREQLEMEIDKFTIIQRDNTTISLMVARRICSALSMTIWVPMPSRENSSCSSAPFLELISPLEQQGILVRRSREQLEMEIDKFTIIQRGSAPRSP
jgi:N-acetylglutamate synthase-like GNAT family acetyltransferase